MTFEREQSVIRQSLQTYRHTTEEQGPAVLSLEKRCE